jgi:hypothetical protein
LCSCASIRLEAGCRLGVVGVPPPRKRMGSCPSLAPHAAGGSCGRPIEPGGVAPPHVAWRRAGAPAAPGSVQAAAPPLLVQG